MSRSYKKPYFKDSATQFMKRKASRAVRKKPLEKQPADGGAYKKEFDSWDISDYSFHAPESKKACRK